MNQLLLSRIAHNIRLAENLKLFNKARLKLTCICCINASKENRKYKLNMSTNEIKNQLHVLHNPFSGATQQPKIPDGKTNDSLGYSTQLVTEIKNAQSKDVLHFVMFAGMNCIVAIDNSDSVSLTGRSVFVPGFEHAGACDWSNAVNATTAFDVKNADNYALWRTVSAGMQLKLLNPTEQDDGWWEAVRLTPEMDASDYQLYTTDESLNRISNGCVAPVGLALSGLLTQNLSNDSTYSTGLIRDLHRIQFELHGKKDNHDFIQMSDKLTLEPADVLAVDALSTVDASFDPGRAMPEDIINQYIDPSYDMVYVRVHCRANTGTSPFLGSRFHMNCVTNQEIKFDAAERDARYHTKTNSVGIDNVTRNLQGRRANGNAAKLVAR
ncbi:MAG: capsid protein [Avonheates virus SG_120]|uniref:capsid protein n=1 Tax=Avonheates virus SG_120 TaxID=2914480 RepID=UPI002481F929|nr:MAG: capsid protein [Avonheates virus SG_120]UNI72624.1 MAG: capsid protein [Avonheates virus SG_120]